MIRSRWPSVSAILCATLLMTVSSAFCAEPQRPRLMVFAVGIEHYDEAELDKIEYAADDARDVYAQLGVVGELDTHSVLLTADDKTNGRISAQELRTELERFVQRIEDNTNVIVYLGGHGTLSRSKKLLFLPTDYSVNARTNSVPFADIVEYFRDWIDGSTLHNVQITFFVNMCGAGNADVAPRPGLTHLGVEDDAELVDAARTLFRDGGFGFKKYAVLPASPRNRNAFEDKTLRRSQFAYYLLEGLRGRASDAKGNITTGALFAYLDQKFGGELSWDSNEYADDILVGATRTLEGEADYLVGTSLLAAAQAVESLPPNRAESDNLFVRPSTLRDLAADHLRRVKGENPDLGARALLRLAQAELLDRAATADVQAYLRQATEGREETLDSEERAAVALLLGDSNEQPAATRAPATLRAFRDELRDGRKFYLLLLGSSDGATTRAPRGFEDDRVQWAEILSHMPNGGGSVSQDLTLETDNLDASRLTAETMSAVKRWAEEAKHANPAERPPVLVVVYDGVSGIRNMAARQEQISADGPPGDRLFPFGQPEIEQLLASWPGSLTILHSAPHGGVLLEHSWSREFSMLLAAKERDGMTFFGDGSNSSLLAQAFQDGVEDPATYQPLLQFLQRFGGAGALETSGDWHVGTPAWIPAVSGGLVDDAQRQLSFLDRWAFHVSAGCASGPASACEARARSSASSGEDPFAALAEAATLDIAGKSPESVGTYRRVTLTLNAGPAPEAASDRALGAAAARDALATIGETIKQRAAGAASKEGRRVIILPVGVADYKSPLVADLPHVAEDLGAYAAALQAKLASDMTNVEVRDVLRPSMREDFLAALRAEIDGASPMRSQDLLILIFSGRGVEIDRRRYLGMAAAAPADEGGASYAASYEEESQDIDWKPEGLADVWDIADLMRGRWFVGIYDVQFAAPVLDAGRHDQVLDRHLDSVRPHPAEAATSSSNSPSAEGIEAIARSRGQMPAHQVHVWVDGTLTTSASVPHPCQFPDIDDHGPTSAASPLAGAIIRSLSAEPPGTYKDWLQVLGRDRCLLDDTTAAALVFQGDVNLPLFASGEGAEFVDYFHNGIARHDANLRAALAVAVDAAENFASAHNRLAVAALLLSLAQLHVAQAELHGWQAQCDEWLARAGKVLDSVDHADLEREKAEDLWPIRYEMLVQLYMMRDEPEQAMGLLLKAEPTTLARGDLARSLVMITDKVLNRQPGVILDDTVEAVARLKDHMDQSSLTAVAKMVRDLARKQDTRLREPFVLEPPAAAAP